MEHNELPKAWESVMNSSSFLPAIVKSIERIHDISWSMEPNIHDWFELVYIKKGNAVFEIAGQPVSIGPNDIIIIKPHQTHKFIVKSETACEFFVLSFKFINKDNTDISRVSLDEFLNFVSNKESGAFIALKVSQRNDIVTLLNKIMYERENQDVGSEFLSYLLVLELFVMISRALKMVWEDNIKNKSPKVKELIDVSLNYINNNFERDISIGDIARYVFLSQSYFARVFKEQTGMSPMNYLLKIRIDRARELLSTSKMKIGEIALSVGFSNQQRFNEIFKKHTRLTPLQYRKKFGEE